ncbi:MAG: tail protein X [Alphaproteobacteria bacterium]|nr:tail protein X [Alphaproteobacteria bacterium]
MIYISKDGETLDFICWLHYGRTAGVVEKVLKANRHLAEVGAVLSAGIRITLPTIDESKSNKKIKLWQ